MKPTVKDVTLSVSHIEQALTLYLKPFFPEAVEIEGVDLSLTLSVPGQVQAKIYLRQKDQKTAPTPSNDNEPVVVAEVVPIEKATKKARKR